MNQWTLLALAFYHCRSVFAAFHHFRARIDAEFALLLRLSMALHALLLEQRLDVAGEIKGLRWRRQFGRVDIRRPGRGAGKKRKGPKAA